jgi:alpha-beta hydrolase superfamily lysophospholipase
MAHLEFETETTDGLKLHGQSWEPESNIKAVICLVHGLGEYSGRYDHVAAAFNREGYALFAFDLRGHGHSEGPRGHAPSYPVLMADISQMLKTAKGHYKDLPIFLYGHSLGGNLVIHYTLREQPALTGIIASAPLFEPSSKPPAWKMAMLRMMYRICPSLALSSGLEDLALSHDLNVIRTYRNDPYVHDRITARLGIDMLKVGRWNLAHAKKLQLPLLLMHGDADRITSVQASIRFAELAGSKCSLKVWKNLYHELHNEPEKGTVMAYMTDWMGNCL